MKTDVEMIQEALEFHDNLTEAYYVDKVIDKAEFEFWHYQNQVDLEEKLISQGFEPYNVELSKEISKKL